MSDLMLALETWLPVVGYEGFYEVSDWGRFKSLPRLTPKGFKGGGILKGTRRESGHIAVSLSKNGNIRIRLLHHLVAEAFIGPRPGRLLVRHLNDIPDDNRAANLAYGTSKDNHADMQRNGHNYFSNRTHCPQLHPYDEANTYVTPTGHRECRACGNARTKARKKRQTLGLAGNPCSTEGCESSATALGLCPKCYIRKRRAQARAAVA